MEDFESVRNRILPESPSEKLCDGHENASYTIEKVYWSKTERATKMVMIVRVTKQDDDSSIIAMKDVRDLIKEIEDHTDFNIYWTQLRSFGASSGTEPYLLEWSKSGFGDDHLKGILKILVARSTSTSKRKKNTECMFPLKTCTKCQVQGHYDVECCGEIGAARIEIQSWNGITRHQLEMKDR